MYLYLGIFLLAFDMLALQVTFSRLLSVTSWYHLAFCMIAIAMLGLTAGAIQVYRNPLRFMPGDNEENLARACLQQTWSMPLALVVLCLTPISFQANIMMFLAFLLLVSAAFLPFYFGGIGTALVLTKSLRPIGTLYASDLLGASLGCVAVLVGMNLLDAPSLVLACAAVGGLAGFTFAWRLPSSKLRWANGVSCLALVALALINSTSSSLIRPVVVKGAVSPATRFLLERWNALSRITVDHQVEASPQYWGPAFNAPRDKVLGYNMAIDGQAGTFLRRFHSLADIEHLRYDLTSVAYHLRPRGGACIIGVGGGRDLQTAILFGHEQVTGVDINPIFIDLIEHRFRDFAGLADRPGVTLVVDDARSHLSRSREKFAVIQMSLIDTWAATGAGAFSLTENSLYTVEAWQVFFDRLADDGVFSVSRWYSPDNLGETGRLISVAAASLLKLGLKPADHIALLTEDNLATLVLSKRPLDAADIAKLQHLVEVYRFKPAILPGHPPQDAILRQLVESRSLAELQNVARGYPLRIEPATDDSPYFFNILKLNHLELWNTQGVARGNLVATYVLLTLIATLLLITLVTVVVPVFLQPWRQTRGQQLPHWSGAVYFSLIGAAFMLVEIGTIQRLSVLLSHPSYGLGILLFSLILSAGVGSLLSERLPLARRPYLFLYPLACVAMILIVNSVLNLMLTHLLQASIAARIAASVCVIFPLGMALGVCFPTGMRLVGSRQADSVPWYWALNGTCGVLCSALAVLISIYIGISMNLYLAAIGYLCTLPCVWSMKRRAEIALP